jgi:pyruvate kinase
LHVLVFAKGPEIRTGNLQAVHDTGDKKAKIELLTGATITLTSDPAWNGKSNAQTMYITYPDIAKTAAVGKVILLDDGAISLTVTSHTADGGVECRVDNDGEIASRRGVNLPGMKVLLPPMSEKDKADIR